MATQATDQGYSRLSIITHWITAIGVIALFLTGEGDEGGAVYVFHVSGGAAFALFLLWRVWRRARRGFPQKPNQAYLLNLASQIVLWGFLTAMIVVSVTGYFIPWSLGQSVDILGLVSVPSPIGASRGLHEFFEEVHELAGNLFVPLLALHVLGAVKHAYIDKDNIVRRIISPLRGGR